MTDDDGRISRRRVLGALGGIGATGALGGGTSALFWDEEVFGNVDVPNVLAAGNLDLKVDWTEHYVDWIGDEAAVGGVRMVDSPDDLGPNEVGLPTPEHPMIAVTTEDTDGDGTAQLTEFRNATVTESSGMTDDPDPVVTLQDVKPGDFGEVTLSYHLEGNPGYVSLCSSVNADGDNGIVEPEDGAGGPDGSDGTSSGDLGEHVQATAWYDPNCNNRFDGEEVEAMLVTDVSESMSEGLTGTPDDIDGETGDGGTRLEAVRGIVGDVDGTGFLSELASSCGSSVEIGSVSASDNLRHLDNLDDGDDSDTDSDGAGNDDGAVKANLDKALGTAGGSDYGDLKNLYAGGKDFSPDFDVDDPINNNSDIDGANGEDQYEAERPYLEDGGSTQTSGVIRAHRALLPDGLTAPSGRTGIDPSGNAADPGDARKIMIVLLDSGFSDQQRTDLQTANDLSTKAKQDDIEILPVVVNDSPTPNTVDFAKALATDEQKPLFAVSYYQSPNSCPDAVTDENFTCMSLDAAMATVRTGMCATAGGESRIAGPGSINEVLGQLDDCLLLDPTLSGSAVSGEFGSPCHATTNDGCVALAWWLPRDIPGVNDNIVQTDRYEFQIGFQATQCRHNGGQTPDTTAGGADTQAGD